MTRRVKCKGVTARCGSGVVDAVMAEVVYDRGAPRLGAPLILIKASPDHTRTVSTRDFSTNMLFILCTYIG